MRAGKCDVRVITCSEEYGDGWLLIGIKAANGSYLWTNCGVAVARWHMKMTAT